MSSCRSRGGFKRRHLDRESAEKHALRYQRTTNVRVDVYRCPNCLFWHVGRHKTTKSEKLHTITQKERLEEIQVGILIGALKLILNKES